MRCYIGDDATNDCADDGIGDELADELAGTQHGTDRPKKLGSVELLAISMGDLQRVVERAGSMETRMVEGSVLPDELRWMPLTRASPSSGCW